MYYVLLSPEFDREQCIKHMKKEGVMPVFHYVPLHSSPAGQRMARVNGSLAVTEDLAYRLLRLPLWVGMDTSMLEFVSRSLHDSLHKQRHSANL